MSHGWKVSKLNEEKRGCYWCAYREKMFCTHKKREIQLMRGLGSSVKALYERRYLVGLKCVLFKGKEEKEKVTFS